MADSRPEWGMRTGSTFATSESQDATFNTNYVAKLGNLPSCLLQRDSIATAKGWLIYFQRRGPEVPIPDNVQQTMTACRLSSIGFSRTRMMTLLSDFNPIPSRTCNSSSGGVH